MEVLSTIEFVIGGVAVAHIVPELGGDGDACQRASGEGEIDSLLLHTALAIGGSVQGESVM
jgi:hypothetical protein